MEFGCFEPNMPGVFGVKDTSFYDAFEDRFRGPCELIKSRLRVYLPFVLPLKAIYEECKIIDLGCGRGEWIELMEDEGFKVQGIDLDDAMLASCREKGLSAAKADAIEYLKKLQDESIAAVSGFHIIEHIPFESLQMLVLEAFRVLKPGGLLILETPNPENLMVSTTEFYMDPTHKRPVPPKLLLFLAEYNNFERVKLLRLQESSSLRTSNDLRLTDVFFGVSPDYAIVAQKNAPIEQLKLFDQAFDKEHGLTVEELAFRYSRNQDVIDYERERWAWWEGEWNKEKARIDRLNGQIDHWRSKVEGLDRELQSVYTSRSWRITAPMRSTFCMLLRVRKRFSMIYQGLQHSAFALKIHIAGAISSIRSTALFLAHRVPPINKWLNRSVPSQSNVSAMGMSSKALFHASDLTVHARGVYLDLSAAIEHKRRRS